MRVYCVPCDVKRPDIVKEILMFALWSFLENGAKFYILDVTKFEFNILFVDIERTSVL